MDQLRLTSKACNLYAGPFVLRHISLHFVFHGIAGDEFSARTQAIIQRILNTPRLRTCLKNTRHITISSWLNPNLEQRRPSARNGMRLTPGDELRKWVSMTQLIEAVPFLRTLNFEAYEQIPVSIIDALRGHQPQAQLHIRNWTRMMYYQDHTDPGEIALSTSPNLRSIHTIDFGISCVYNLATPLFVKGFLLGLAAFSRVLALSPNLQCVDIYFNWDMSSVDGSTRISEIRGLERKMKLFTWDRKVPASTKTMNFTGLDFSNTSLEESIDLSTLENLDVDRFMSLLADYGIQRLSGM